MRNKILSIILLVTFSTPSFSDGKVELKLRCDGVQTKGFHKETPTVGNKTVYISFYDGMRRGTTTWGWKTISKCSQVEKSDEYYSCSTIEPSGETPSNYFNSFKLDRIDLSVILISQIHDIRLTRKFEGQCDIAKEAKI